MNKNILVLIFLMLFYRVPAQNPNYNVMDFGAFNDGKRVTTASIQKAIDACSEKGGGTINFPAGKYLSGTLFLKNNIVLNLHAGAELLGSGDLKDYPSAPAHFPSYADNYTERSLIFAENLRNIAITGQGKINGQGYLFEPVYLPYKIRPYIIRMIKCQDVTLRDITIENPPMWTQHYLACENLTIDNIKVDSWNSNVNNDGIDIDCCNRVMISNSYIKAEDDAIVLKSTSPLPCQNVTITNCVITSLCNAFKCGTESVGGFENIIISNCIITDTRYSGIALEMVDGGYMNNVIVSDIVMKDVNNPVFVRLGDRGRPFREGAPEKPAGTMRNIKITNITATGAGCYTSDKYSDLYKKQNRRQPDEKIGCLIMGIPGHYIENLSLKNISIEFRGGGTKESAGILVPENEKGYPNYDKFGNVPAYAFFTRHVKHLEMENIDMSYELPDHRPALVMMDVKNATIDKFNAAYEEDTESIIVIDGSENITVSNCRAIKKTNALANLRNASSGIRFINNNIFNTNNLYKSDGSVSNADITVR